MDMQRLWNSIDGFEMAPPALVISHPLLGILLQTNFSLDQGDGDIASDTFCSIFLK